MESKYYTPSIEEFHVGVETELFHGDVGQWGKYVWKLDDTPYEFREHIDEECIRVKYLDREDIEELVKEINPWWDYSRNDDCYTSWKLSEFKYVWISNNNPTNIWITHINANNGERNDCPFYIKNKSELIKLLKQLGINEI